MSLDPKKFKTGIAVTGSATVGGDVVTTNTAAQTLVNKTIDADSNTISNIDNADIKAAAGIDASKIADGSVSNAEFQSLDGVTSAVQGQIDSKLALAGGTMSGDIAMGGNKVTGLAAPTASGDAASKAYVDSIAEGLKPKASVRAATVADITLSGLQTIDGVSLAAGERLLVKDQTNAEDNGIYLVAVGAYSRTTDFDSLSPIDEINGALVAVREGTVNAGRIYVQSTQVDVLGVDPIGFVLFNSSATLVGGDGITVSGSNISVDHDGLGLDFVANQLSLELDGSTLSKSASGVKVADGGISDTQINASAGIDASKLADGSVSNTELQYINSLTSNAQTQLDNKASVTLDNLGSTAINANLVPATDIAINLGTAALRYNSGYVRTSFSDTLNIVLSGVVKGSLKNSSTLPSGVNANIALQNSDYDGVLGIASVNYFSTGSTSTPNVHIETGIINNVAASGDTGNINMITGVNSGTGARGKVSISAANLDMNSSKIVNVQDPTANQDAATKAYVDAQVSNSGSPGDIAETSFAAANNQASLANVTGFAFSNAAVRSFKAHVVVEIDATANLYEVFQLEGVQKGADWSLSYSASGDDSLITFNITSGGQVQYTSADYIGFVSADIKFRAITLSV